MGVHGNFGSIFNIFDLYRGEISCTKISYWHKYFHHIIIVLCGISLPLCKRHIGANEEEYNKPSEFINDNGGNEACIGRRKLRSITMEAIIESCDD